MRGLGRQRLAIAGMVAATTMMMAMPAVATAQDSAPPIGGEASTEDRQEETDAAGLVVTDVRVGTHDGFDRVTFEIEGDGDAGWFILYEDDPVSDGSGLPVDVAGDASLRVVLTGMALPPDAPEGVETFLDDVAGPDGGIILEVVNDTVFEGQHTFFVGLGEELPFRVGRLQEPARVVIDIVHPDDAPVTDREPDPDEEAAVPVGGVETGQGGAATGPAAGTLVLVLGALLVALGAGLFLRRRPAD
jgi:LPXTG-motif cell wall-anchored protein